MNLRHFWHIFLVFFLFPSVVFAGPIYVFKEADGSIRFTTKTPPAGVQAEVFTSKGSSFSYYRGSYFTSKSSRLNQKAFAPLIDKVATTHRLDPYLLKAVIHVESAFNPRAVSPKGAKGLMQLMPGTARLVGVRNAFDPEQNMHGGARYLAYLLRRFSGNLRFALAAYNAGPEAVARYGGIPPYSETRDYVQQVLIMQRRYSAVARG